MGAEGTALHKRGVSEAKHAKHKLLTTKACNNCGSRRGSTTGGRGKNTAQTADSEGKYE